MKDGFISLFIILIALLIFSSATNGFSTFTLEMDRRHNVHTNPVLLENVQFYNQEGQITTLDSYKGKYLIVDFIYTNCKLTCHALGIFFKKIQDMILNDKALDNVVLLSISFDLRYDSIETLNSYQSKFTKNTEHWEVLLPKSQTELDYLLRKFNVTVIDDSMGNYIHNSAVHFVSPNSSLYKIIDWDDLTELESELQRYKQ